MSGGRLVVLDRNSRDVKHFLLPSGLATLGSDPACDIRVMLPSVSAHHATVVVHSNQTVVRNVSDGDTLVNGECVSVAALGHGDVITVGGRMLRWEYAAPPTRHHRAEPALPAWNRGGRSGRSRRGRARRASAAAAGAPAALARPPALRLALEMSQRASMPGSTGGKQVAIVQPQRRDADERDDQNPSRSPAQANKRPRASKSDLDTSATESESDNSKRKSSARASPKVSKMQNTTKATLWIESRKSSPRKSAKGQTPTLQQVARTRRSLPAGRKSTPLRLAVLKRAQSAHKGRATKIQAPLHIDRTKRAAIMLMAGHTPRSRALAARASVPSVVVKKPSPVRSPAPGPRARRSSRRSPGDSTVPILEITDSDAQLSVRESTASRPSRQKSLQRSPLLPSPKKSALKDPRAKKSMRKTESIKFDLSNLEGHSQGSDVLLVSDATERTYARSDDELTLRYSESPAASPSPRRSIHSRSGQMLEKSLGTSLDLSLSPSRTRTLTPSRTCTLTPESLRARRSVRGGVMLQKALDGNRTLSPRSPGARDLESYSIVDLVSDESGRSASVYGSAGSGASTAFGTPRGGGRSTRSTIDPGLLSSSTPYVRAARAPPRSCLGVAGSSGSLNGTARSSAWRSTSCASRSSVATRRSQSLATPENTEDSKKHVSVNSTKISRASKSRSRITDADLSLVDDEENDDSPKSSRRVSRARSEPAGGGSPGTSPGGTSTPENTSYPEEATTPVLSIQSLLDSSRGSPAAHASPRGLRARPSFPTKRNTFGGVTRAVVRTGATSQSMNFTARKTRLRLSSDSVEEVDKDGSVLDADEEVVTPRSDVRLVQEGVKNKHSTAKKPQSKRSIIDDLNESDFVKQLFNSPVKRKLSQSMTEFSRKQLFDDDVGPARRPPRYTIAGTAPTPDDSLPDNSDCFTPERFVSPIGSPRGSPDLSGLNRLFARNTPANDLTNVKGVKTLLRTPRTRRSVRNDLSDVTGVKAMFGRSPANRLSDVRVKEVFAAPLADDLRRVTGVKSLFQPENKPRSPRNDLTDVRGVKRLFKGGSPKNDLSDVFGVKRTMRRHSPRNDYTAVRGVRRMFREEKQQNNGLEDVSGVEELFDTSHQSYRDTDRLFDQLIGKPPVKAVYSKTFTSRLAPRTKRQKRTSLRKSLDLITTNVEQWLEQELQKRLHKKDADTTKLADRSKNNLTRELQKLATDTVAGTTPLRKSRVRNTTVCKSIETERKRSAADIYSAHTLPIKKRSLVETSIDTREANVLPIKKRAVVHSTPVKERVNMTMNASELGRVSPIAVVDKTSTVEQDTFIRSTQQSEETVKPRARRQVKAKNEVEASLSAEFKVPSPKKTRAKTKASSSTKAKRVSPAKTKQPIPVQTKNASPPKARSTRHTKGKLVESVEHVTKVSPAKAAVSKTPSTRSTRSRRTATTADSNIKKRRASIVVTKKPPGMSPKPRATRNKKEPPAPAAEESTKIVQSPKIIPKKTRAARKKDTPVEKVKTPKNTRSKAQSGAGDIEPAAQAKPKASKTVRLQESEKPKRGRKTTHKDAESPKESQTETKMKTRGNDTEVLSTTRSGRTKAVTQDSKDSETGIDKTTRGRKKAAPEPAEDTTVEKNSGKVSTKSRTRSKKGSAQESLESEPAPRGRRTAKPDAAVPVASSRKRKTTVADDVPSKVAKVKDVVEGRGRRRVVETVVTETANGRQRRSVVKDSRVEITRRGAGDGAGTRLVRSRTVVDIVVTVDSKDEPKTRGRKPAVAPAAATRKRKPSAEPSPVKDARRRQPGGNKARKTVHSSPAPAAPAGGRNRRR